MPNSVRRNTKDINKTIKYLTLAAQQNSSLAEYNLGKLYEEGQDVKQNYYLAVKFYKLSADKNFAKAQKKLAGLYLKGLGVKKDKNESNNLLKLSNLNEPKNTLKIIRGISSIAINKCLKTNND